MSIFRREINRLQNHPSSKNLQKQFKFLEPISIWRAKDETFYRCNKGYCENIEKVYDFDFNSFLEIVKNKLGSLPDGYYFAAHNSKKGGFLFTDDYDQMIQKLMERSLIE